MDFLSDLKLAIVSEFQRQGISFPESADLDHLASRYLEMRICRVEPVPRKVHFSEEIHDSLGNLSPRNGPESPWKSFRSMGDGFLSPAPFRKWRHSDAVPIEGGKQY